jgi:hypothetical protein
MGVNWNKLREKRSPYVPDVKHCWDTQNFDQYEEEEPWYPSEAKGIKGRKKNTEFIGYTYKPVNEVNSALVKALVDLDSYKTSSRQISEASSSLEYLQLEKNDFEFHSPNRFKKTQDKTDRFNKEYSATMAVLARKKNEEKEKERYKFYYGDTPEKKPSPGNKGKRSPKASPKQSPKQSPKGHSHKMSPATKDRDDTRRLKPKVGLVKKI